MNVTGEVVVVTIEGRFEFEVLPDSSISSTTDQALLKIGDPADYPIELAGGVSIADLREAKFLCVLINCWTDSSFEHDLSSASRSVKLLGVARGEEETEDGSLIVDTLIVKGSARGGSFVARTKNGDRFTVRFTAKSTTVSMIQDDDGQ